MSESSLRTLKCELLSDGAAHRVADKMEALDSELVCERGEILSQSVDAVGALIGRCVRLSMSSVV